MTSTPASRSAREMTLMPRSWPSRPTLAVRMRIRLPAASLPAIDGILSARVRANPGRSSGRALRKAMGDADRSLRVWQVRDVRSIDGGASAAGAEQRARQTHGDAGTATRRLQHTAEAVGAGERADGALQRQPGIRFRDGAVAGRLAGRQAGDVHDA